MDNFDLTTWIMRFENSELDEEEIISGFQHLIDTGIVWQLQGSYGRVAADLINSGYCTQAKQVTT